MFDLVMPAAPAPLHEQTASTSLSNQTSDRMRQLCAAVTLIVGLAAASSAAIAEPAASAGPYKVLKTVNAGGEGGYDYIFADEEDRRLYIPRSGPAGRLAIHDLDTLDPVGEIGVKAGGATVDPKSHHGFSTTKPITMWDSKSLKVIKTIDVDNPPDGIMFDPYNERVWVTSHAPHATVIDAKTGTVVGTPDLGGESEQAVSDGKGTVFINIADKAKIAVVDAKSLTVKARYDVSSKGSGGTGLALDAVNHVLFAYYMKPCRIVVILNAENGNIITTLPTGTGIVDTVAFNPATMEAISADTSGTMTFIKEHSPTSFTVEQSLPTMLYAKCLTLDRKTNRLFTMAAAFGPAAPNAPTHFGLPARGPQISGSFTVLMVGK